MLVYANHFSLRPIDGTQAIVREIASWVGKSRGTFINPDQLARGIRELRMSDGATLSSRVTRDEEGAPVFPYFFCARLLHPDSHVSGRRWLTEIGMRQFKSKEDILCSVLLQTEEMSARVNSPITVTCPRIVRNLIENCNPVGHTPSQSVIQLTEANAPAFLYEIERADREYPLVLLSYQADGSSTVTPERLRQVMIGLGQVIEIPETADTFAIEGKIGRRYSAFGGAINIIFPYQKSDTGGFCRNIRLHSDRLEELKTGGESVESEILSIISHQTNVPNSWRHISAEMVRQEVLRTRLRKVAEANRAAGDLSAYDELLAEAGESLEERGEAINELREALELSEGNYAQAQAEVESLKHALSGVSSAADFDPTALASSISPLRELFEAAWNKNLSLEQALQLCQTLFPERLVVLKSAFSSARESDRGGFQYGDKALGLLMKLCTTYWQSLVKGEGDQNARAIFGKNGFAAKEAASLSTGGQERRTFSYRNKGVFMERHLKYGVKDSVAETLRIHFEWVEDRQEIVIGHCGKHLNF